MTSNRTEHIHDVVLHILSTITKSVVDNIGDEDDVFTKYGLNSMEIVSVLVEIETTFDVVIGEDPTDFTRIRTFAGLRGLLDERLQASEAPAELSGALQP